MFAKMLPPVPGPAHFLKAFPTESAFLQKLQGPLNEALKSPDGHDGPKWSPKCFLARDDLVILENMGAQGYKARDQQTEVHMEYHRQVCKALARFHAAGLLFAQNHGREAATERCPELKDCVLFSDDYNLGGSGLRNATVDSLSSILILMLTPEEKPRLKELQESLLEMGRCVKDIIGQVNSGPLVPQHGDCHLDNFLFKFDDKGNPIHAVLIDFQLARFGVPAFDLCFILYLSASAEFAKKHWDELFQIYYDTLGKETARCGLQIEKILPFGDLTSGADRIRKVTLLMACMYSTVFNAPRMELGKIMMDPFNYRRFMLGCRSAEVIRWFDSDPMYRAKIESMLREILDLQPRA